MCCRRTRALGPPAHEDLPRGSEPSARLKFLSIGVAADSGSVRARAAGPPSAPAAIRHPLGSGQRRPPSRSAQDGLARTGGGGAKRAAAGGKPSGPAAPGCEPGCAGPGGVPRRCSAPGNFVRGDRVSASAASGEGANGGFARAAGSALEEPLSAR